MARYIPADIIEEIVARADIVEIIGEYVPLKRRGRNFFGLCPFHNEDTESFAVNPERQFFNCFGCGKGGNIISFIREIESLSFSEAAEKLADRVGVKLPEESLSPKMQAQARERHDLLRMHELACDFYRRKLVDAATPNAGTAYLTKRGVSAEMAERFSLGYAPLDEWQALYDYLSQNGFSGEQMLKAGLVSRSAKNGRYYDKFHGRLIFPIRDYRGEVIAFGGRTLVDDVAKYLNSMNTPIFNKSTQLYALDLAAAAIRATDSVVVMEGYMDVLTAHQFGVANAVASLGTAFTAEHARLLKRYAPESPHRLTVYLSFDGDNAGIKAAVSGLAKLRGLDYIRIKIISLPPGEDPDDFLRREGQVGWQNLLDKHSYDVLDFLLMLAMKRYDYHSSSGTGDIVRELLPAIAATPSAVERDAFIRSMASRLGAAPQSIYDDLRKSGLKVRDPRPSITRNASREPIINRVSTQLVRLAIENGRIFHLIGEELNDKDYAYEEEKQLIGLINRVDHEYDYNPATLFNYLGEENEGLRQFLLKLLQTDIPDGDPDKLAQDYIRALKLERVRRELDDLNNRIAAAEQLKQPVRELLVEKMRLNTVYNRLKG